MHLGNQNFPRSPVSPVMGFPESPVLLFSAGGVLPEGANRFPCVRSMSTERVFGVPRARQLLNAVGLRKSLLRANVRYLDRRTRSSCSNLSNW
jgi:hypothetical protein